MNTGGPAFPAPEVGVQLHDYNGNVSGCRVFTPSQGMTLLDWMAGQALAGLCASPETQMPFDVMHRLAYGHAEAMLDEKARREGVDSGIKTTQLEDGSTVESVLADSSVGKRIAMLEELNRELVEALRFMVRSCAPNKKQDPALFAAREYAVSTLAKAKGGA